MWKKLQNWMAVVMLTIATCLNCGMVSANSTAEMDVEELIYECDNVTWSNSGSKLTVEGTFYNLSSECDVIELNDVVFGMFDSDGDLIFTIDVDTSDIEVIPHDGSYTLTIFVDDVDDIPQQYKKKNSLISDIEDGTFTYGVCEGKNCSYCGGSNGSNRNTRKSTNSNSNTSSSDDYDYWIECSGCKGSGVCSMCDGTGRKSTGRMCTHCDGTGECPRCEGKGERKLILVNGKEYVVCPSCHGSTVCSFCDGTGKGDYYRTFGQLSCYGCKGSGVCNTCRGKGYTNY